MWELETRAILRTKQSIDYDILRWKGMKIAFFLMHWKLAFVSVGIRANLLRK